MGENYIICPECGVPQDKDTLYRNDCMCNDCGAFINIDNMYDDMYWDDETDYYKRLLDGLGRRKGDKEDMNIPVIGLDDEDEVVQTPSFIFRFIAKVDYDVIKKSFELLNGDIDYMSLEQNGPIREYLKTAGGMKLKKGLEIPDDFDEYVVEGSFIFGDANDDDKKVLISTLCQSFPLFIVREEDSSYIMTNNKGLAKGIIDIANEDQIEILSQYLTGYEKSQLLVHYLYWCAEPYKTKNAKDIMIRWIDNGLISLDTLRAAKQISMEWISYLSSLNEVQVSVSDKDPGVMIPFEKMLEDCYEDVKVSDENLINVISLRGVAEFALGTEEEKDDVSKAETK